MHAVIVNCGNEIFHFQKISCLISNHHRQIDNYDRESAMMMYLHQSLLVFFVSEQSLRWTLLSINPHTLIVTSQYYTFHTLHRIISIMSFSSSLSCWHTLLWHCPFSQLFSQFTLSLAIIGSISYEIIIWNKKSHMCILYSTADYSAKRNQKSFLSLSSIMTRSKVINGSLISCSSVCMNVRLTNNYCHYYYWNYHFIVRDSNIIFPPRLVC